MLEIIVNGRETEVTEGSTVADFLETKGLHERLVVVELNEAILPRSAFGATRFAAGDRVEIVHFVGGG